MTISPNNTVIVNRVTHVCAEELLGQVRVVSRVGAVEPFSCPACGAPFVLLDTVVYIDGVTDGAGLPLSWLRKFDVAVADVQRGTSVREVA